MIILKLQGGLGNQMFQYATGLSLAKRLNTNLFLDLRFYSQDFSKKNTTPRKYNLNCFKLKPKLLPRSILKALEILAYNNWLNVSLFQEKGEDFNQKFNCISGHTYMIGSWQSLRYFEDNQDLVRQQFQFKQLLKNKSKEVLKHIKSTNSVSIHVRRTDYIHNTKISKIHQVCDLEYYQKAIKELAKKVKNPHFFIFSDDIQWCKKNLKIKQSTNFIDHNTKGYQDMELMSQCQHNIIANSSFSWWAAWLNLNHQKIVISPNKWFQNYNINPKDKFPQEWTLI